MKKIIIKDSGELKKLLNELGGEILDANIYNQLYFNIIDSIKQHEKVFSQSNTFWNLVLVSLDNERVLKLCKIFDQENNSLSLNNLLHAIKANMHLFEENSYKERLKNNPFLKVFLMYRQSLDETKLNEDIRYVSKQNPLVKKLMIWRNNIVAHIGVKTTLERTILTTNPLEKKDIESLLDWSYQTFNYYSTMFDSSTISKKLAGQDDYKNLLRLAELGLKVQENDKV